MAAGAIAVTGCGVPMIPLPPPPGFDGLIVGLSPSYRHQPPYLIRVQADEAHYERAVTECSEEPEYDWDYTVPERFTYVGDGPGVRLADTCPLSAIYLERIHPRYVAVAIDHHIARPVRQILPQMLGDDRNRLVAGAREPLALSQVVGQDSQRLPLHPLRDLCVYAPVGVPAQHAGDEAGVQLTPIARN